MSSFSAKPGHTVVFIVFPEVKLLDLSGALQVFEDANSVCAASYETAILALRAGPVKTDTAVSVSADAISKWPDRTIDTLIVAGGPGTRAASRDERLIAEVRHLAAASTRVASICTGAYVLAAAGLLDGRRATSNKMSFAWVREQGPDVDWVSRARWVEDEQLFTSSGVSAGMDMSLAVIKRLHDEETARKAARYAEYTWHEDAAHDPFADHYGLA